MRNPLVFLLVLAFLVSTLCGCSSKYGKQETLVNYYPQCYDPIQKLRDDETSTTNQTVGGAALGALFGGVVGALTTGKVEGALVGAAAGGVAGGVAGNMIAKKRQIADENARMSSYLRDLDGDIAGLNIVSASARTSLQCYEKQFSLLIKGYKEKRITQDQLRSMYAEIRSGTKEAASLLGNAVAQGRDLEKQYQDALIQEQQTIASNTTTVSAQSAQSGKQVSPTEQKARKREANATLKQAQQRTARLSNKVDQLESEKKAAEAREIAQSKEIEMLCNASTACLEKAADYTA